MSIQIDFELCRGCKVCELACSYYNFGEFNPKRSRVKVVKLDDMGVDIPVVCIQCGKCVGECPMEALKLDKNESVSVDTEKCTGCGICAKFCPLGAITIDLKTGFANVCDLCKGAPKCIEHCPTGALSRCVQTYILPNILAKKRRMDYARKLVRQESEVKRK